MYASIITLLILDFEWLYQNIILNLKQCVSFYYWTFTSLFESRCRFQQILETHLESKGVVEFLDVVHIFNEYVYVWLRKVSPEEFFLHLDILNICRNKEKISEIFLQFLISTPALFGVRATYISDTFISIFCPVLRNEIVKKGAEVLKKVGERERESQMDLAKVVPGLTSLEMLVPQVQAATVNVVQVSGGNTVANPQAPVAVNSGQNNVHNSVSVVTGADSVDNNTGSHVITDLHDSRPIIHQNCASVTEHVSDIQNKPDDSQSLQDGTQVSPHIQKVGQPYKNKDISESEQEEKTPVYRLIMKEGRDIEHYYSSEQSVDVISGSESNNAVSYSSQDLIKILKKKKDRETNKINENSIASLPKFQHAFGRQLYQSIEGTTTTAACVQTSSDSEATPSQFPRTSISDNNSLRGNEGVVVVAEKEDNTLSKAVQTVLKEAESTKIQTQTTAIQQISSATQIHKETPEITNQSQGVIFTCKVPISLSNSSLLQGKPVAILKGSSDLIVHGQKITDDIKKDSVIRSNMSALLAAALQTTPLKSASAAGSLKKQEKGEITRESLNKVMSNAQLQKVKRPNTLATNTSTKLVRPEAIQTGSSANPSLLTIPLPARTVVLAMNQPRAIATSTNVKIDRTTDQSNVCSSTLEQLREFESVLEHVTNTSQMKERFVKKPNQTTSVNPQDIITVQSQSQQTQVSHQSTIVHQATIVQQQQQQQQNTTNNQQQQTTNTSTPSSPKNTTPTHNSTEFSSPIEITERVVTLVSKGGSTTVQAVQTTGNVQKMSGTPVVVVQSCNNRPNSPSPTPSHKLKITKAKAKSTTICKTTPITTASTTTIKSDQNGFTQDEPRGFISLRPEDGLQLGQIKVSTLTKPQQKPQEDEQTTQRIYAILDKYAEQLRNSPELKNKPAPRRRSNPPTNPAQSSKRKGSKKSGSCCSVDASPGGGCCDDMRTVGSEDSSTEPPATPAAVRHTDDISLPAHLQPEDISSETCESSTDSKEVTTQTVQQPQTTTAQIQTTVRQINQNQPLEKQQTVTGRTLLLQESLPAGSVLNVEQATKVLAGKQLVVGTPATVPLTLSLPSAANLKQVIFPVPTDGRPFVVAKVPKMYRVHQVTVPGNSPLIAASTGGAVLLRQMCLNKTTVKQVKVPVQVSGIAGTSGVVLPGGSGSFTLDGESLVLDNNTIVLNTGQSSCSGSGVSVSTSTGATVSLLQRAPASTSNTTSRTTTSSSTMTSHNDHIFTQDQALQTPTLTNDIKFVNRSSDTVDERNIQKPWLHILKEIKVADDQPSLDTKEDTITSDKGCSTKETAAGKYMVESVIKVKPSLSSDKNDCAWNSLSNNSSSTVLSVRSSTIGRSNNTNRAATSLSQDTWRKSRDLRLQKSLSEECEDLGVDKPSTSDLFPEAELLLDTDPLSRDSLHEMYSSSSRDSSPTPRYQWKKRGLASRLLGKRQDSDSSCPSTPLNGDQGEDESETGSECDWWPGSGENGRAHHGGNGISNSSTTSTVPPVNHVTRKRKIGLYASDSDDTDLEDSSSEKGGLSLKNTCPPYKKECQFLNGSPIRSDNIKLMDEHIQSTNHQSQISHCTSVSTPSINLKTEIGQKLKSPTSSNRLQLNRKR